MNVPKMKFTTKIFLGLIGGVLLGIAANRLGWAEEVQKYVQPLGTLFIRLISMIIIPLVFASLLVGTASLNDIRKLGRIGGKTLAYYLVTTVVAIAIGLLLANIVGPGRGLSEESQQILRAGHEDILAKVETLEKPSLIDTVVNIVPTNPIAALAEGNMLQLIFFAMMTGAVLTMIDPNRARTVLAFFEGVNDAMIRMVHVVMKFAPYGIFALVAGIVATLGLDILKTLIIYTSVVIFGLFLHAVLIYGVSMRVFTNIKGLDFFRGIRQAMVVAFSTSSSSATLPVTIECCEEKLAIPTEICSFVLPLGATINMNGTALFQGVSAVFIAQVYGMDLSIGQQLTVVLTATLAAIGTAGAPASGAVMLTMVLKSINVPLEGIALIWGMERLIDMCRTTVNVTGDAACAAVVAATEGIRLRSSEDAGT